MDKLPQQPKDVNQKGDENDNIFKFPPDMKDLRQRFQRLLDYAEREEEFYKSLGATTNNTTCPQKDFTSEAFKECKQDIKILKKSNELEASATLATYGTIRELTSLYTILDELSTLEDMLNKRRSVLKYAKLLHENAKVQNSDNLRRSQISNTIRDAQNSISLFDAVVTAGNSASNKRSDLKQQRERSKSAISDEISIYDKELNRKKVSRQFTEGKSKVSKWTKVKAAFKWERANVPALGDGSKTSHDMVKSIGLMPLNNEVARYLRVPATPYGGRSSADSMLSSTTDHFMNEVCTPGTISSASSTDEIDNVPHTALTSHVGRDSSQSTMRCDSRISDEGTSSSNCCKFLSSNEAEQLVNPISCICNNMFTQSRTSNKSFRKNKAKSDFEVLPEDCVATITTKRTKAPPSPLNLELQQDLNDLEDFYLLQQLRTPRDGSQQDNRLKKVGSPGNSSVPSSPSRLSDFFAELESEDLSSGDFSEPTSPNNLSPQKAYQYKQNEINRRYELLRKKLDMEFEAKKREWEKMRANVNVCRVHAYTLVSSPKIEETQPCQAKLLEENLTPEFKKKLQKWRVKKQTATEIEPQQNQILLNKDMNNDAKAKIDWSLWKAGQIKLEGQGLTSLPEHKNLPEEFQKKLEQWNKIKKNGNLFSGTESIKRSTKSGESLRKSSDDDRIVEKEKRSAAHKIIEKDKLEKISKLKAMVADHPVKEVQVKTSAGVMKFEGISRKFTRKLYEWEKARGIGPESSTFALLHPGYCPIDVGRISKENKAENSPTLSRSLSLDSIAPNITQSNISQQASSLSLNDVNDLKEREGVNNNDVLAEAQYKKFEEPEAVMVEVEDHIVETAKPLISAHALIEQQTPIYKYEKTTCNDYCNTRHIQSYESHSNLAPLLAVLKRSDELLNELAHSTLDMLINEELQQCHNMLCIIRNVIPSFMENLMKPPVLNAISDVQSELSRLNELILNTPFDEACCQEIIEERSKAYSEELKGLNEALDLLRLNIEGPNTNNATDLAASNMNITSTVQQNSLNYVAPDAIRTIQSSNSSELSEWQGDSLKKLETVENSIAKCKNTSNTSIATTIGSKKKIRLRKMGSRQNSKTESDSSDSDSASIQETPRRWKRKNYRIKQRSFDAEDLKRNEDSTKAIYNRFNDDMVYVLRVKPGHPIEQCEMNRISETLNGSRVLISPTESCVQLMPASVKADPEDTEVSVNNDLLSNIFVKTIRKIFRTVEEPSSSCGMVVVEQYLDENISDTTDINETRTLDIDSSQSMIENTLTANSQVPIVDDRFVNMSLKEVKGDKLKNENKMLPKPEPCKLRQWSWSWNDIREIEVHDKRKYQSSENIRLDCNRGFKTPLATDSFKINKRNCFKNTCFGNKSMCIAPKRKEHLFKKNTEKLYKMFSKSYGTTLKKCDVTMVSKTNTSQMVNNSADKFHCKFSNDHTFTPFVTKAWNNGDPLSDELFKLPPKLLTPLSERAQRLQRAKQHFLEGTMPRPRSLNKNKNDSQHQSVWEQNHLSDHNASTDNEEGNLLKSLSAGTILQVEHKQQSETTYDTLPRSASSRSEKLSARLGFASIASKFRRTKKDAKQSSASITNVVVGCSALSTLCRQSLFADPIASSHAVVAETGQQKEMVIVKKSQSLQAATGYINANVVTPSGLEKLNKSKSEQHVRKPKEI